MATNAAEFTIPGQFEYRGVIYHSLIHEYININMLDKWKVAPTDVVVATYPKSGTTWMGSILPKLLDVKDGRHNFQQVPFLEFRMENLFPLICEHTDELPHPRMFKTHLMYEFFQNKVEKEKVKVILVIREPKDTITSYYFMYQQPIMGSYPGTFHEFFQLFKNKKLEYGDVFEWTVEWWKRRNLSNIHVVKYEDLKNNCVAELQKMCDFLGHKHEPQRLQEIAEECSFKKMSSEKMFDKTKAPKGGLKPTDTSFFRKGIVGDWMNVMNEEQAQYIDEQMKKYYEPVELYYDV